MNRKNSNSKIEHRLEELREVPPRNPKQAAQGRAHFLSEAAKYQQAVSPAMNSRQSVWTSLIRKEKFAMNALISLILAFTMVLGGGATAVAAQNDLPNQALYPVKLWTENATLALTGDPSTKANLLMNMAQTRGEEMAALAEMGITPPDQVRERLEQQLNQILMLAADMDEASLTQTLLLLRDRLQTQDRIMEQLHVNTDAEPQITRTRQMLQNQLQLVDKGLADPQGFQYMMQNQMQYGQDEETIPGPNQQGGPDSQQNGQGTEAPGNGNGPDGVNGNGNGGETPGGQNPDNSQGANGGNGAGNGSSGGQNPESPQGGSGSGSGSGSGNGSGGKP